MGLIDKGRNTPKSMVGTCILDILSEASEDSPLTQKQVEDRLKDEYGISVDRKTVHHHLEAIAASVSGLRYREKVRTVNGEEVPMMTDLWLDREDAFEESELRALVWTVAFSRHIPTSIKRDLIRKLEATVPKDMKKRIGSYLYEDGSSADDYNQLFWNIELLSDAIEEGKRVSFQYTYYDAKGRLRASERTVTANPLGIGASEGDFYLLATVNGVEHDSPELMMSHFKAVIRAMETDEVRVDSFRLDRVHGVVILDEPAERPGVDGSLRLSGARRGRLDVQEYARENPTLASGHSVRAELRLVESGRCTLSDVVDHFGRANVRASAEPAEDRRAPRAYAVSVRAVDGDVRDFALRGTPDVEVLKPDWLRDELRDAYRTILGRMDDGARSCEG